MNYSELNWAWYKTPVFKVDGFLNQPLHANQNQTISIWTFDKNKKSSLLKCEMTLVSHPEKTFEKRIKISILNISQPQYIILEPETRLNTFMKVLSRCYTMESEQNSSDQKTISLTNQKISEFVSKSGMTEIEDDQMTLLNLMIKIQLEQNILIKDSSNSVTGLFSSANYPQSLIENIEAFLLLNELCYSIKEFHFIKKGLTLISSPNKISKDDLITYMLSISKHVEKVSGSESFNFLFKNVINLYDKINNSGNDKIQISDLQSLKETCLFFKMLKEIAA